MIEHRRLAAIIVLCSLVGCAQTSHVSDGLAFRAPDGWKDTSESADPDVELWEPADKRQSGILSLARDLPAFDAAIVVKSLVTHNGKLMAQHSMTLCGNQPSVYSRVIQKAQHGPGTYTWEIVTSRTPSVLWEAEYMYHTGLPPNPQAQAALSELCPIKP